jgi:diphosphomevalonate decarboxylase
MEQEALDMHAVCMTGSPKIQYLTKASTDFLVWLRTERISGRLPAWATIDAGPNIHLICLKRDSDAVVKAVQNSGFNCTVIVDQVGSGPSITEGSGERFND